MLEVFVVKKLSTSAFIEARDIVLAVMFVECVECVVERVS